MSEINYQALREAAEAIKIAATPQKFLAFRMKVTPQVVLALLDEREAQNKRIAELEANFAALAAENAALKRFIKDSCYVFHGEQADISDEYSPADESPLMPDTPAIDAILEKSRAQGIQIAINELVALAPSLDKRTMDAFSVAVERLRKLLKKGASSEQN
ncbi:ead/Ea22-like family protein [Escherichia coli]|uniref:ead/Ea22-like family protein n=1 Tax=Escherichia coli TaxID=562 RepID=UPI002852EE90|nr:ead/Ea22-like family protein [Escherichia coli]